MVPATSTSSGSEYLIYLNDNDLAAQSSLDYVAFTEFTVDTSGVTNAFLDEATLDFTASGIFLVKLFVDVINFGADLTGQFAGFEWAGSHLYQPYRASQETHFEDARLIAYPGSVFRLQPTAQNPTDSSPVTFNNGYLQVTQVA